MSFITLEVILMWAHVRFFFFLSKLIVAKFKIIKWL